MQFKEFRHYVEGDDIRHMSWTVTARTGKATLKLYEEDRELNIVAVVDVSGSSQFGQRARKIDMYTELLALLGLSTTHNQDNFGTLLFNDAPMDYLPPRRAANYIHTALAKLEKQSLDNKKSDIRPALKYLCHALKTPSIVILISDFAMPDFHQELRLLSQKHEPILLHCYDDAERGMGKQDGIYEVWDPEEGGYDLLDTGSPEVRNVLNLNFFKRSDELQKLARNCKSDYLTLSVEDDYLQRLVHFFRNRGNLRG